MSGTACALSHFDTDCLDTPNLLASSSWDQPFFFLQSMILSASIIVNLLSLRRSHLAAFITCLKPYSQH